MSIAIKSARMRTQGRRATGRSAAGDPGLFGFLGKVARKAVSFIPGVGPIASEVMGLAGIGRDKPRALPQALALPTRGISMPAQPRPFVRGVEALAPGGLTGQEVVSVACPSGYHANKADYYLKDGSFVGKGTRCVKNRRRNPMNARALSRAISRVDGGKRFQHTLAGIETHKYTKAGNRKEHTHA